MFSDEATFHVSGKLNKQNVNFWGQEQTHGTVDNIRDNPKFKEELEYRLDIVHVTNGVHADCV